MKTSKRSMELEIKMTEWLVDARKRRAYVHPMFMRRLTPIEYEHSIDWLAKQGFGVNVFPINHVHPPLSMAILGLHLNAVRSLLSHKADPHLTYPTEIGRSSPMQVLIENMIKYKNDKKRFQKLLQIFKMMLIYGANVDKDLSPTNKISFRALIEKDLPNINDLISKKNESL